MPDTEKLRGYSDINYALPKDSVNRTESFNDDERQSYYSIGRTSPSENAESNQSYQVLSYSTGLCLNAALCYFNFGYAVGVTNALEAYMVEAGNWCPELDDRSIWTLGGNSADPYCELGQKYLRIINSILYIGAMLGAIVGAHRMHVKGRREALIAANVFYAVGSLISGTGNNVFAFTLGRITTGIGIGITTIGVPTLVNEASLDRRRGFLGGVAQSFIGLGIVIVAFVEMPLVSSYIDNLLVRGSFGWSSIKPSYWRICLLIPMLPALSSLLLWSYIFVYDTPNWLVTSQRYGEAHTVLLKLHSDNLDEIVPVDREGTKHKASMDHLFDLTKSELMFGNQKNLGIIDTFKCRIYRRPLIVGIMLSITQQLSGINSLISSSMRLFKDAHMSSDGAVFATFLLSMSNFVATCLSSFFIEMFGRRVLLRFGCFAMGSLLGCGSLFVFLSHSDIKSSWEAFMTASTVIGAVFVFSLTLGPVTWVYLSEIFPSESIAAGMCVCGVINWLSSFTCVCLGRILETGESLLVFSVVCWIGLFTSTRWALETKGTTQGDTPLAPRGSRSFSIHSNLERNSEVSWDRRAHSVLTPVFNRKKIHKDILNSRLQDNLLPNNRRNV